MRMAIRATLQPPRSLFERLRPTPASPGIPGLISSLQAYGGLRASATRAHRTSRTMGRIGTLEVRLARTAAEVRQAQKVRYKVFYQEGSAVPNPARRLARRDIDGYDAICDHLLVIDHAAHDRGALNRPAVVGTFGCCANRSLKSMADSTPPVSLISELSLPATAVCNSLSSAGLAYFRPIGSSAPSNFSGTVFTPTSCKINAM